MNVLCCIHRERILRVLSRIFGGFLVDVTILFAGTSSFAEETTQENCEKHGYTWLGDKCCVLYDEKLGCITYDDWNTYFEGKCNPDAGYIDVNSEPQCCPDGMGNSETHLCCDAPEVFDIEQLACVTPDGCPYDWYWDEATQQCCAFYYFDENKGEYTCVTGDEFDNNIFPAYLEEPCDGQAAGYINKNGEWQCCPSGTTPNNKSHQCECGEPGYIFNTVTEICEPSCDAGYYYADGECKICDAGSYCVGDNTLHECPAGTYSNIGATSCSNISAGYYGSAGATSNHGNGACAQGSYSAAGASACTACPNGFTTSGTGSTSSSACTACSNNANVTSWVGQSWSPNTVSHLCEIASNGCASGYERTGSSPYTCTLVQSNTNCYKFAIDNTTNGGNNNNGATTEFWMYRNTSNLSDSKNCKIYPTANDCGNNTNVIGVNDSIVLPTPPAHAYYAGQYSTTGNYASYPTNEGWFDGNGVNNIAAASSYGRCANSSYTNTYFSDLVSRFGFQANSTPSITLRTLYACDYGYHLNNGSCVANTITLDWDESGGSTIENRTCTYDGNLVLPSPPTRAGYTFANWWLADGTYHDVGETITGGCNSTYTGVSEGTSQYIHAVWTPIDYTITYDFTNGGAFGSNTTHPATYNITSSDFTISRPTYTGHNFSGWTVSTAPTAWGSGSSSTGALDFTVATGTYGNITLTATWDTSTVTCSSGQYLPAGATSCSACLAGYRCPAQSATYSYNANNAQGLTACSNSTQYQNETGQTSCKNVSTGYYKQSNSAQHICPTGYQSGPGAANESECQASCAAGERVAEVNAACSSPASDSNDGWFSAAHNVYYGNLSPVSYCMLGYVNTDTGSTKHNSVATCRNTIDAGYYISNNKINKVTAIRVLAPSNAAVNILELAAYTNPEGDVIDNSLLRNGNSGIAATGTVASGTGAYATNKNWADNRYTTVNAGGAAVWVLQSQSDLGSLRLALKPDTRVNVRIDVQINNNNWVQVFNQIMVQDKAIAQGNMGELIVLTGLPTVCGGGTYRISGAVGLGNTPSCSTLGAIYYSSGGGTSATPSSTGNGCLSGYTCGQCPSGYRDSSVTGKTAASDCKANITLNKNGGTGTVNGTTGTASATKECSYGVSCSFESASLVPTSGGYKFTGGWGTTDTCDSSTTSFSNPTGTYYACIDSCSYTNSSAATPSSNVCAGTCDTGYSTSGGSNTGTAASCSGTECSCSGKNYTVTLDKNGGSGGTTTVTATFGDPMPTITVPSRQSYESFGGYFDGNSNMYYDSAGESARNWDKAQNATLTASWSGEGVSCSPGYYLPANQSVCNTACPSGYYCPGNQSYAVSSSNQGLIACPPRQSNDLGNSTVSVGSDANASAVTNCFIQWLPDGCAASVAPKNYGGGVNITTTYYSEKVKVYAQNDGTGGQDAYPSADQYIYPAKLYSLPGYAVVPNGSYNGVSNAVTIPEISQSGHKGLYGVVGKSCTACTGNSYGPGGGQVKWQNANTVTMYGECKSCASGLTASTVNSTVYHDDAGDCGRILHIGTYEIRLKSIPSGFTVPSPSLRFDYDNDGTADFYARMSLNASPMRVTSTQQISNPAKNFKTTYNNSTYYVCDDGTCQ